MGSENVIENSFEKVIPKAPQMDPNSCQNRWNALSKRNLNKEPSRGAGKVRYGYLLHFNTSSENVCPAHAICIFYKMQQYDIPVLYYVAPVLHYADPVLHYAGPVLHSAGPVVD